MITPDYHELAVAVEQDGRGCLSNRIMIIQCVSMSLQIFSLFGDHQVFRC